MNTEPSPSVSGVLHLHLDRHEDGRGFFMETFRANWLRDATFTQGNLSSSSRGVLRGLHYHRHQDDLWMMPNGRAFVAVVDLRRGSPNGFFAVTPTLMSYLATNYCGTDELGVRWIDREIGIEWPTHAPLLSERDRNNPYWRHVPGELRPEATDG